MYVTSQSNEFDLCPECRVASHAPDRFCRHCGVELNTRTRLLAITERPATGLGGTLSPYTTAPLAVLPTRRPVSAPLVRLVTTDLPTLSSGNWARRITLVLISLPIWLMMILLSPFDAYSAAKAIAQRM